MIECARNSFILLSERIVRVKNCDESLPIGKTLLRQSELNPVI